MYLYGTQNKQVVLLVLIDFHIFLNYFASVLLLLLQVGMLRVLS